MRVRCMCTCVGAGVLVPAPGATTERRSRISAYQRVYHERSDTLIQTLIRADMRISVWYADTRISVYQRVQLISGIKKVLCLEIR